MEPEDVLLEAISAASLHGDSAELRSLMCKKLKMAMQNAEMFHVEHVKVVRDDASEA